MRADVAARAEDRRWSSAGAHVMRRSDGFTQISALAGVHRQLARDA